MKTRFGIVAVILAVLVSGCGSSGGSSGSSTNSATADSLSDLPATSTLVNGGGAAASLSAKSVGKAVTGTPTLLKNITSSNVDTYFWNGLLATIGNTAAASITEAQRTAYWQAEGACRMAQTVGFSFQHVLTGGTSLCYMQNAPSAANGVAITSGTATASTLFDQGASNKVIKVVVSSPGGGSEDIFIKAYGTGSSEGSSGYAADLWFCGSGSANGYEQIRVNTSANTLTTTSAHSDFGSFVGTITASLTTNASGQIVFDSSKDRSATVYFGPTNGTFKFLGSVTINSAGIITARDYNTGTFGGQTNTNKHAVFANYTGNTMDELRFSTASFALQDTFNSNLMTITDATEYNTNKYVNVDTGTLLTTAREERFDGDIYNGTSSTIYSTAQTKLSAISGFSCSTTPDVVVTMDFSQSGPIAVAALCDNHFNDNGDMNFCDGSAVQEARNKIFLSQSLAYGDCSTSRCPYDVVDGVNTGVFACQQWADDHRDNGQGITTGNATCSTSNCCAKQ